MRLPRLEEMIIYVCGLLRRVRIGTRRKVRKEKGLQQWSSCGKSASDQEFLGRELSKIPPTVSCRIGPTGRWGRVLRGGISKSHGKGRTNSVVP